jgi:hypothetical protein
MIQAAHAAPAPSRCHVVCFLLLPRARDPVRSLAVGPGGRPAPEESDAEGGGPRVRRGRRVSTSLTLRCATLVPADTAPALRCCSRVVNTQPGNIETYPVFSGLWRRSASLAVGVKLAVNRLLFVLLLLAGVVCPRVQAVVRAPQLENGDGAAAIAWSAAPGFAVQPAANAFAADCCGYVEWREGALRRQASGQWGRTDEAPGASCDYAARQDILAEPSIAAGATERNSLLERMAGWLYAELGQPPTAPPNCPAYVYDACRVFTGSSFAAESGGSRVLLEAGKEGKHIRGHNNFIPGRSPLSTITPKASSMILQVWDNR